MTDHPVQPPRAPEILPAAQPQEAAPRAPMVEVPYGGNIGEGAAVRPPNRWVWPLSTALLWATRAAAVLALLAALLAGLISLSNAVTSAAPVPAADVRPSVPDVRPDVRPSVPDVRPDVRPPVTDTQLKWPMTDTPWERAVTDTQLKWPMTDTTREGC